MYLDPIRTPYSDTPKGLTTRALDHLTRADARLDMAHNQRQNAAQAIRYGFEDLARKYATASAHNARQAQRHVTAGLVLARVATLGNQGARMHSRRGN